MRVLRAHRLSASLVLLLLMLLLVALPSAAAGGVGSHLRICG